VIRFVDKNGVEYNDSRQVSVQPWWSVYGAVALLAVAVAAALPLLRADVKAFPESTVRDDHARDRQRDNGQVEPQR
jgi:hypothetical protein